MSMPYGGMAAAKALGAGGAVAKNWSHNHATAGPVASRRLQISRLGIGQKGGKAEKTGDKPTLIPAHPLCRRIMRVESRNWTR